MVPIYFPDPASWADMVMGYEEFGLPHDLDVVPKFFYFIQIRRFYVFLWCQTMNMILSLIFLDLVQKLFSKKCNLKAWEIFNEAKLTKHAENLADFTVTVKLPIYISPKTESLVKRIGFC